MTKFVVSGCLSRQEVKVLEKDVDHYKQNVVDAMLKNSTHGSYKDTNIRSCKLCGIDFLRYPNTINILQSLLIENYKPIYGSLNYSLISELQYLEYTTGDFFKRHNDVINADNDQRRVLTMSVNLSDPQDYEGGQLIVYNNGSRYALEKTKGSFIIIPAFMEHEAKVVTSGKRKVLICWLNNNISLLQQFRSDFDTI